MPAAPTDWSSSARAPRRRVTLWVTVGSSYPILSRPDLSCCNVLTSANGQDGTAQDAAYPLAKVGVAGSNPVVRYTEGCRSDATTTRRDPTPNPPRARNRAAPCRAASDRSRRAQSPPEGQARRWRRLRLGGVECGSCGAGWQVPYFAESVR